LDSLYVVDSDSYSDVRRIQYYGTGKDVIDRQYVRQSWEHMLQDSNPEVREMALKLVKYTFFSAGYGFGPFTFSNLVPVLFWTDAYQEANNIVDIKGNPFNKFLENEITSDHLSKDKVIKERFKRQFMQNHGEKEAFTFTVTVDNMMKPLEKGISAEQENEALTLAAKEAKGGIIQTAKGNLIVNLAKNSYLAPQINNSEPVEFIKVKIGKKRFTIYQLVKTRFDHKNGFLDFEGKTNLRTATYVPLTNLGENNFAVEFDFNTDLNVSSLKENKAVPVKSIAQSAEDAFMDSLTAAALTPDESKTVPTTVEPNSIQNLADIKPVEAPKKSNALSSMVDTSLSERPGLFETIANKDYDEYTAAGGKMSKENFLSLPPKGQQHAIWQAKNNC
jgi:hypothetical protein